MLQQLRLAALRVGYGIAPPALARAVNVVRHPYNVSTTSLLLAETVLRDFGAVQDAMLAQSLKNRDRLIAILGRLPGARVFPAHANIVLVCLTPAEAAPRLASELATRGVLVKDASGLPRLTVWPQLEMAMSLSPEYFDFLTRFQEANEAMGVYNDDTGP